MSCVIYMCINHLIKPSPFKCLYNFLRIYPCKLLILLLVVSFASFSILLKQQQYQSNYYALYFYIICFVVYAASSSVDLFSKLFASRFFNGISDPSFSLNNEYYSLFDTISNTGWCYFFIF